MRIKIVDFNQSSDDIYVICDSEGIDLIIEALHNWRKEQKYGTKHACNGSCKESVSDEERGLMVAAGEEDH